MVAFTAEGKAQQPWPQVGDGHDAIPGTRLARAASARAGPARTRTRGWKDVGSQGFRDQRDLEQELRGCSQQGLARANKTLRNVKAAWVKEQQVHVSKGAITEYQVNMMVTFVIDD